MKFGLLISATVFAARLAHAVPTSIADVIMSHASRDGIDLSESNTPRTTRARLHESEDEELETSSTFTAHAEPDWYRNVAPFTGGNADRNDGGGTPSPAWNVSSHLDFMDTIGISHSVLGFTSPSANAFLGDKARTVALARLINEQLAAYARTYPDSFHFFAAMPLPYTDEAITELKYAVTELGAVGVALMSNHEGHYLGYDSFTPFWQAMDGLGGRQVVYVHPTTPWLNINETWIPANPYSDIDESRMEFYMETARTFIDLTLKQTIHNFTNTHFVLPHIGGAFPTMIDRVLKTVHTELYESSLEIFRTRFWWDSASPTYFHQINGLLAYDIPKANLLYGTDYPFISAAVTAADFDSIMAYPGLSDEEKEDLLSNNYKILFGDKLHFQ
ncbi:amidohydrolase 2 [Ephemerocybe angulata]|uniref:Amidohydrolase 2 n=1 Tax=Ephemerocybe angulata TaxID=980116 RepID=A0A8H6LW56_9AGAR|nr:amidohydrolase 2 [Tulosesus angulatus]